jgi:flagellin-like protein
MTQNNLKSCIRRFTPKKRRAVAEVISSLLLVAITVVGAVVLTTFLDEAFISGGLAATGSDSTIKTVKLIKYDSRDGGNLMEYANLNNTLSSPPELCRSSCISNNISNPNTNPANAGSEFMVIQIENQSLNPIFLHNVWLGNVTHVWDSNSATFDLDASVPSSLSGDFPGDGTFSILTADLSPSHLDYLLQREDNEIQSGESVNILVKLDVDNPDIQASKTIRTQFNIGANQLSEFLIESGGAQ